MFVTVQGLILSIDKNIQFLNEGIESGKADESYIEHMEELIQRQFRKLQEISCNKKLIKKYSKKIQELPKERR